VLRALARACSALACIFHRSTFRLDGYDRTFDHAEKSLLNAFSTNITRAVGAAATPSRDLVNFIYVDDAHAVIA
jgi:hypothetical protein